PSSQGKQVLGVLFEHNIYARRVAPEYGLCRVMIGGIRYPEVLDYSDASLEALALEELKTTVGFRAEPVETFLMKWNRAIPHYDEDYLQTRLTD
ncbi:MAG: hypothetical protein KC713_00915, partial [Candidatus Omnitrophica bacterium]|nr:hypothetical protein [Candidatus Omnitrophota bacterium]